MIPTPARTLRWPLPNQWNTVTQVWNHPHQDASGAWGHHAGIDVALTKERVPIYAPADGMVIARHDQNDGPAGLWLLVEIALEGASVYWNAQHEFGSAGRLRPGSKVTRGQPIAWTGDSGFENGLNLHFGLAWKPTLGSYADNLDTFDPLPYFVEPPGLVYAPGSGH